MNEKECLKYMEEEYIKGAREMGASVVDIGQISTDGLYFASGYLNLPGIMLTASHNPPEYSGMKFCREKAVPLSYNNGLKFIKKM